MKFILTKATLKDLLSIKTCIYILITIFIYVICSINLYNVLGGDRNELLFLMLSGKYTFTILGKMLYVLSKFIILSLIGNYIYCFFKYSSTYYLLRTGSILKVYISILISSIIVIILYYVSIAILYQTLNYKYLVFNITFVKILLSSILVGIIDTLTYLLIYLLIFFISKNSIVSYIITLIFQLISIYILNTNLIISKIFPLTQLLIMQYSDIKSFNYNYALSFNFILFLIPIFIIKKRTFEIVSLKEN